MDEEIRLAAFDWLNKQTSFHGDELPRRLLESGFIFRNQRITLMGAQGIWKPKIMSLPISITTVPDSPYDDGELGSGTWQYRYRGRDPYHYANVGLRNLMKMNKPLIYFYGISKGIYVAQWPVYIVYDSMQNLSFTLLIEENLRVADFSNTDPIEIGSKMYKTVTTITRLHQRSFRQKILQAYRNQCSLCHLRHAELLDAAHIIADRDDRGDPVVQNGLSLCKIHHAAFDRHILGITPDYTIKIRQDILEEVDGPMLKYGIQSLENAKIILPGSKRDWPDRDRLDQRFQVFLSAG